MKHQCTQRFAKTQAKTTHPRRSIISLWRNGGEYTQGTRQGKKIMTNDCMQLSPKEALSTMLMGTSPFLPSERLISWRTGCRRQAVCRGGRLERCCSVIRHCRCFTAGAALTGVIKPNLLISYKPHCRLRGTPRSLTETSRRVETPRGGGAGDCLLKKRN